MATNHLYRVAYRRTDWRPGTSLQYRYYLSVATARSFIDNKLLAGNRFDLAPISEIRVDRVPLGDVWEHVARFDGESWCPVPIEGG